ncbi:MAG: NADH-quinone oxidoreductase subunit A [Bdellovibrionales bacterium]
MFLKLIYFFIFLCLPLLLLIVNYFVNIKRLLTRRLLSSFECGFDTFRNARSSFSLHFFLIRIIFLVFDLEIIFLIPLPL